MLLAFASFFLYVLLDVFCLTFALNYLFPCKTKLSFFFLSKCKFKLKFHGNNYKISKCFDCKRQSRKFRVAVRGLRLRRGSLPFLNPLSFSRLIANFALHNLSYVDVDFLACCILHYSLCFLFVFVFVFFFYFCCAFFYVNDRASGAETSVKRQMTNRKSNVDCYSDL